MEEDSGQLLDSDLDSSQSQFPSQAGSSSGGGHPVKNYRSKSLPAPFFPQIPTFHSAEEGDGSGQRVGDKVSLGQRRSNPHHPRHPDDLVIRDDRHGKLIGISKREVC